MTAAAVDIDDPIPVPDAEILVVLPGQKVRGRVADNANGVRVRAPALCGHTAPDTGLAVSAWAAVDEVELLCASRDVQLVRQAGEKPQDHVPLMGRPVIEQLPVGGRSAILPPQVPRPVLIVRTKGIQTHLLVVAQEHGHVGRSHDTIQNIHAHGAPVDHIPEDVQVVAVRKLDQIQQPLKFIKLSMNVRYTIDHGPPPSSLNEVTESYHSLWKGTSFSPLLSSKAAPPKQ